MATSKSRTESGATPAVAKKKAARKPAKKPVTGKAAVKATAAAPAVGRKSRVRAEAAALPELD